MYIQNQLIIISSLIITHGLKGLPNHFLCEHGLYQLAHCPRKRTLPEKIIKKRVIGLCRGFTIDGKFYSLTALEKISYPVTKVINIEQEDYCPF